MLEGVMNFDGVSVCPHSQAGWQLEPLVPLVFVLCDLRRGKHHPDTPLQLTHATDGWHGLPGRRTAN